MNFLGTKQVAQLLGLKPGRINQALWDGRIFPTPARGPGDSFYWTPEDVARCAKLFNVPWPPRPAAASTPAAPPAEAPTSADA